MKRIAWLVVLLPAATLAQELGDDLVIETEKGAMREPGEAPKVEVVLAGDIPLEKSPITVRVSGMSLQEVKEVRVQVDGQEAGVLTAPPYVLEYDFGKEGAPHKILATVIREAGPALQGSRVTRGLPPGTFQATVDVVIVNVIVKDASGNRVRDLERDEFTILEDGVPQKVSDFSRERTPISIAMILDSSGSMEGRLWSLKKSAIDFARKVDADVPIQVLDFDHEVRLQQEFTTDREKVAAAINRAEVGGGTHLWDAAYAGVFALDGKDGRRCAILFTDGVDESGDDETRVASGLDDVVGLALDARVQIYAIGFGNKIDLETLGKLAGQTGGVFYKADSTKEFRAVYDAILADVAAQYTLTYTSSQPRQDGTFRKIEVRLSRPDLTAFYRKGYTAGGSKKTSR